MSMALEAVNQTTTCGLIPDVDVSDVAMSFTEKAMSLAGNLYDIGKEAICAHPWIALTTVMAIGVGSYFLFRSSEVPLPSAQAFIHQIVSLPSAKQSDRFIKPLVLEFVDKAFISTQLKNQLGPEGANPKLKQFLADKIKKIVDGEASPQSKVEMVNRVIQNFGHEISTARARLGSDISAGRLEYLGIARGDKIATIHPLGDETHYGGKGPLKIIFESGKTIVYKPRSMMPEKLLCDEREGLLRHEGFGTYKVVCREDSSGDAYGYSEFVQNIPDRNRVNTKEELGEYVRKMCVLDALSKELGLSDLHYKNIITSDLNPCIIDAEVFMNPPHIKSGVLDASTGSLYHFDIMQGQVKGFKGENKIWIDPKITEKSEHDFTYGMSEEALASIGIDVAEIRDNVTLSTNTRQALPEVREALGGEPGRFVLKETPHLSTMQYNLDHRDEKSIRIFVESVRDWVNDERGFQFQEESVPGIIEGVKRDALNHDVPAFHYDSQRNVILYHGTVIGVPE